MSRLSEEQIKDLLEKSAVVSESDYLHLARTMGKVIRCHAIPMINRPTLAEHTVNLLFIIDFMYFNGHIKGITSEEYLRIKTWLQYHDIEETVTGDTPYHFAKLVSEESDQVRKYISSRFIENLDLTDKEMKLAKIIDMLDFILTMQDEVVRETCYAGLRSKKILKNGVDSLRDQLKSLKDSGASIDLEAVFGSRN